MILETLMKAWSYLGTFNKAQKAAQKRKERNMEEYGMGFAACEKPLGTNGRYSRLLEQFAESGDECICCGFEDVRKAKAAQASISAIARKGFVGVKCSREGSTVYVSKGQ